MMRYAFFLVHQPELGNLKRSLAVVHLFVWFIFGPMFRSCSVPNVLNVLRGKAATDLFDASPGLDFFSKVQGSTG